jgi:signal transduction histidine kinase
MKWLPAFSILLFGASAGYFYLFWYAWKRRKEPSGFFFSLMLLSVIAWMIPQGLEYLVPSVSSKIWCSKISYLGGVTVSVFLFETIYSYIATIRKWSPALLIALLILPCIFFFFVLTNGTFHSLLWTSVTPLPGTNGQLLSYEHGMMFVMIAAYSYLLVLGTIFMLLYYSLRTDTLFRRRYYALIIASLAPWLGNVLYIGKITPLRGIDFSVVGFLLSTIILYFVLYKWHFLDLKPIAYDVLMKSENRGAIVLDTEQRIIVINHAVENCFDLPKNSIGKTIFAVFAQYPSFITAVQSPQSVEIYRHTNLNSASSTLEEMACEIQKTPIMVRDNQVGTLLQIHDISHRIKTQKNLELQNKIQEALLAISHMLLSQDQHYNGLIQTMNIVGRSLHADYLRIIRYKPQSKTPWSVLATYAEKNVSTSSSSSPLMIPPILEWLDSMHTSKEMNTFTQGHPYVVPSTFLSDDTPDSKYLPVLHQQSIALIPIQKTQKKLEPRSSSASSTSDSLWGYVEVIRKKKDLIADAEFSPPELQMMEMIASLYTEYTIRKVIQNRLQESKDRFEQVVNQAREIIWETDCHMNITYLSSSFHKLFSIPGGINKTKWFSVRSFVSQFFQYNRDPDQVSTEDKPIQVEDRFKKQLQKFRDHFKKHKPLQDFLMQILDFKGNTLYLLVNAIPVFDKDHKFRGYRGSGFDVTLMKQLEIMKDSFINTVSHEFRTPLFAIRESINMVRKESLGPLLPDQKSTLDISLRNSDRLVRLINDILNYQKFESGRFTLQPAPVDARSIIREAFFTLSPLADQKGIKLQKAISEECPQLYVDKDMVVQVFINIISNAVKYTSHGSIQVRGFPEHWNDTLDRADDSSHKNLLHFTVTDTGIGIKEEDIAKLFHTFSQISSNDQPKTEGTGLGLVISKRIVDLHKGKIWVQSKWGEGTTFHILLPIHEEV